MNAEGFAVALPGGRRRMSLAVGPIAVVVTEVPGQGMTAGERNDVRLARRSYNEMWGGDGSDVVTNDPHDGFEEGPIVARHYLAWVRDGSGPARLVTMRKVSLVPGRMTGEQLVEPGELLPVDIRFWMAGTVPLWRALCTHLRMLAPGEEWPEYRWAAIGRTATYPHDGSGRSGRDRELTAIAFAAIQLLAVDGDASLLWVDTLCPEFHEKVLGVDLDGMHFAPEFTPTERTLGLPVGVVHMDNALKVVREHKTRFPGYFVNNDDACRILGELLELGLVSLADLAAAVFHLVEQEDGSQPRDLVEILAVRDHRRCARLLTRPRFMKYLIPLLTGDEPLRRMSTADFRTRLIDGSGDGPFSSTVTPTAWAASARAVLAAAEWKYGDDHPVGQRHVRSGRATE